MADDKLPTARPRRIWRIVLVVSLALNLAVAGLVVGSVVSGRAGDGPPRSFNLGLGPITRALEIQERRTIGRELRQDRNLNDIDFRAHAERMVAILREEPFDPAALRALMDQRAANTQDIQARAQGAFIDVIVDMSPERRRAFTERVAEELSRDKPRRTRNSGG